MSYANQQDIQEFYKVAQSRDFARDFLFRIGDINLPDVSFNDTELVYVKSAELPARSITNVATPYMGLDFNVPGNTTYPGSDAYALKFYLDADSALRSKMEQASRTVFNDQFSTGQYNTPLPEHYIILQQLDKALNVTNTYKLVGASIREIQATSYDMAAGNGGTVELDATISYHYYEMSGKQGNPTATIGENVRPGGAGGFGNF